MHSATIGLALIASLASGQTAVQQPKRLHFKVVLATRVHMVQRDDQGLVTLRRGFIEPSQVKAIEAAIALAKESVETSSGGKVEVSFNTLNDPEAYYAWFDPNRIWVNNLGKGVDHSAFGQDGQILGKAFAEDVIGPWLNEDGFGTEISPNYGPFDGAIIIHAGLTMERSTVTIQKTPVHVMSWHTFTQDEPVRALAQILSGLAADKAEIPHPVIPEPEASAAFGEFSAEAYNDPQAGNVLRIVNNGIVARGGVVIADSAGKSGSLKLNVRTRSTAPFSIVGVDSANKPIGVAILGNLIARPIESPVIPTTAYGASADEKWQTYVIPLEQLGGTPVKIYAGLHPYASSVEVAQSGKPLFEIAGIEFSTQAPTAPLPEAPTLATESPDLLAALSSSNVSVRMDAAWKLTEIKLPESVLPLIEMTKSSNPLEVMAAVPALAFQDAPEGWAAIKNLLFTGPFDVNRRFAAVAMTGKLTVADVPDMTPALAVRSWRTRKAVVDALISMEGREASIILGTSLDDPFPQVRLKIVESISLREDTMLRRLIFTAVNDPCQYVRSTTFIRLMDVENELIRSDALKGVRDESVGVRLAILNAMAESPKAHYRSALRIAVTDSSALVRSAALEALTLQPDPVDPNEIRNTFSDSDEGVQLALVRMAKTGQVVLPPEVIQSLKTSIHESVREAAKDLI